MKATQAKIATSEAGSTTNVSPTRGTCRFCQAELGHPFIDLGLSPLCETVIASDQLDLMEPFYPLRVYVCERCLLVQLDEYVSPEAIFTEYAYFSSYSDSWVQHAKRYAKMAIERFGLGPDHFVTEIASNDGYLLQHFVERGIPVIGIEPAANVAKAAIARGIPTVVRFFGQHAARELAHEHGKADLIIGNNVLAQVPHLNDFVEGMKLMLKPRGVITMEFPHLMQLISGNQFDTIYHEHFSYFSLVTVQQVMASHGLSLVDLEELPTHGGSLRIYVRHAEDDSEPVSGRVVGLLARERAEGIMRLGYYDTFAEKVRETKRGILEFLIRTKREGKRVAGYGAPGKGNTLLNYCGIRTDFLDYTVDRNPFKQGKFTPGTRIPIYAPEKIRETRPDYVFILAWNLKDEIMTQMECIREWGGKFVVPIPRIQVS